MLKNANLVNKLVAKAEAKHGKPFTYTVFSQTWPTTALGYDMPGCDCITTADTIVIYNLDGPAMVYYESERLAYEVNNPNQKFFEDLARQNLSNKNIYEKNIEKE